MRYASVTDRLSGLAGAKWALHARARAMQAAGEQIIELTIGEPDVSTPTRFIAAATRATSSRGRRAGSHSTTCRPAAVPATSAWPGRWRATAYQPVPCSAASRAM